MVRSLKLLLVIALVPWSGEGLAASAGMKPYPAPESGYERLVFRVPPRPDENMAKIEIMVGKEMDVDCNLYRFSGTIERRTAKGWGFPYYVLNKVGGPASTLMACPPGEDKKKAFVYVQGKGQLQRYNSKLPTVVYVPKGFEVHYRIWTPQGEMGKAQAK